MSRDVSLTVLSKNTSTSNIDEILVGDRFYRSFSQRRLERSQYFVKIRSLRSEFSLIRHPAIAARRSALRPEFGPLDNEPMI